MDKKHYEEPGYQHAQNGDARLFPVNAASWQANAYWRGVRRHTAEAAVTAAKVLVTGGTNISALGRVVDRQAAMVVLNGGARDPGKAHHVIDLDRMAANTKGWPTGAQEHAKRLAADLNQEFSVRRRARLTRALVRLQSRYAAKKPAPKIWVDELVG